MDMAFFIFKLLDRRKFTMVNKITISFLAFILLLSFLYYPSYVHAFFDRISRTEVVDVRIGEWTFGGQQSRRFLFSDEKLSDFKKTGIWREDKGGFRSGFGLLYIENPYEEYTIITRAILGIEQDNQAVSGGFGILFETSIDENLADTGYVVQFDRGFGGVVIRPRTAGNEGSAIIAITNQQNKYIPVSKRDPFWREERIITIQVKQVESSHTQKYVSVWIDDVMVIENIIIKSTIQQGNSFTGFRSWNTVTEYRELEIIPNK
jgi:hypothetical protein